MGLEPPEEKIFDSGCSTEAPSAIIGTASITIKYLTPVLGGKIKSQRYYRYMRWIERVGKCRKPPRGSRRAYRGLK